MRNKRRRVDYAAATSGPPTPVRRFSTIRASGSAPGYVFGGRASFDPSAVSSATVQRSPLSIRSAVDHDCTRCTTPPRTTNVSPVNGQSAVDKYATNGDTLAGSHSSKPSAGAFTTSDSPGVASVNRVRAPGAIVLERTP